MINRKITVNIDSTLKYIQLWNGIFNLTDKEMQILSTFIDVQIVTEEMNLCSVLNKKKVAKIIGIWDYNTLNNYIKKFKDKGVMLKQNGYYKLNPFLNPETDSVHVTIQR